MGVAIAKLLLAGGHRVEAAGLALCLGADARLAQVQEPGGARGAAGGGGGLGDMNADTDDTEGTGREPGDRHHHPPD